MGPIQPFGGLGSVEAGLGGPLVTKDVEKAKVPQGVHGGGRVGLMLGVGHGCWGAEGVGEGEYKGSSWELMGAEGKVGGVPAKQGEDHHHHHQVETRSQKSRESLSYSRCRSVASLVVEVESIVLSSLRRRAVEVILVATSQYPLRRAFSSLTPSSARASLPQCNLRRQKPPLKVQRSPFPNPTFRRTRGHLELHNVLAHMFQHVSSRRVVALNGSKRDLWRGVRVSRKR